MKLVYLVESMILLIHCQYLHYDFVKTMGNEINEFVESKKKKAKKEQKDNQAADTKDEE